MLSRLTSVAMADEEKTTAKSMSSAPKPDPKFEVSIASATTCPGSRLVNVNDANGIYI